MKVEQVFHMNGGTEDKSYAMNSLFQRQAVAKTQPIIEKAIIGLISNSNFSGRNNTLAIVDLGCASGPNTLLTISEVIKVVEKATMKLGQKSPEFQAFLSDLPGNDFNSVFRSLQGFREKMKEETVPNSELSLLFNGVPGSFYNRLFPVESLHFVHSAYSLQFLSGFPEGLEEANKGNIFITTRSPSSVLKAYSTQFEKDFSLFLRCRAQELIAGGRIVLTFPGRRCDEDPLNNQACYYMLELLSMVLYEMASEGLIDHEKLDSFDIPAYLPSAREVEVQIQKEGLFTIEHQLPKGFQDSGFDVVNSMRAVTESMLVHQLELQTEMIDEVLSRYSVIFAAQMVHDKTYFVNVTVSLSRH